VKRIVALRRQHPVDVDQVLHPGDFRAQNDAVVRQPVALRLPRRLQRAHHHRPFGHFRGIQRLRKAGVLVHHPRQQRGIQRAPVHADPDGLAILKGAFDHCTEIVIRFSANIYVARVNSVFGESFCAIRILFQKDVAVVMEIPYDGRTIPEGLQRFNEPRHGTSGFLGVDRHTDDFRAGARKLHHLVCSRGNIRRVRVRHRLDDNRMPAAYLHAAHVDANGLSPLNLRHFASGKFHSSSTKREDAGKRCGS
jgi:hypothetical protein